MTSTSTLIDVQQRRRHNVPQQNHEQDLKTTGSSLTNDSRDVNKKKAPSAWKWWTMTVAAFIIGGWAFHFMYDQPPGGEGYDKIRDRILGNPLGWAHVGGGGLAMVLGPFQFLRSLRRTGRRATSVGGGPGGSGPRFSAHSWVGRLYAVAVLASGVGSVDIIRKSDLYRFGTVGFVALGTSWIVTACLGWAAMWKEKPDVDSHKKWMTRNFALTYAAVMLRWQFPLMIILGMELKLALSWSGWVSWVPNLVFVNYYILPSTKSR